MKKTILVVVLFLLFFICMREYRSAGDAPRELSGSRAATENSVPGEMSSSKKPAEGTRPAESGSDFSAVEVEKTLRHHNQARSAIGARPLTWSVDLARYAQEWADHLAASGCGFDHRPESGQWRQKYGENLFKGTAGYYGVGEAVDAWISEKQFYTGQTLDEANYHQFGHYTQVVWKGTKQVGCGKALCNGEVIIVCNYTPAGNVIGEKAW